MRDRTLAAVMLALLFGGIVLSAAPSGKEAPGGAAVRAVSSPTPPRALPTARGGHVPASEATTPAPSSPPTATPARTIPAIIAEAAREFGVAPETLMAIPQSSTSRVFQTSRRFSQQSAREMLANPRNGSETSDWLIQSQPNTPSAVFQTHSVATSDTSTGGGQASADPAGGMT